MNVILKKRLSQLAVVVLLATILPYVFFPLMPHFLFVVATDSMSPTINRGDIVIVSDSRVTNGSIVVFRNPIDKGYEVHRICGIQHIGNHTYYMTKGDAVNHTDSFLIPQENVVGVVGTIVPYIGLYYLIPRLPALLLTMSLIGLYVTIAFYENRRQSLEAEPEEKKARNTKRRTKPQRAIKPTTKKIGIAVLALFLISLLVQPPLMLAGVNLVYPQSQHPATVTTPKIALENGVEGSSTIGDGGNSATVTVDGSYVTVPWWDGKYDYRKKVTVTEPNKIARTYEPVEVTLNFDQGKCYSQDTIRVAYWNGSSWSEIDSQVFDVTLWGDNTVRQATILWLADVGLNSSKDYYVYYDDDGEVSAPSYTGLTTPSVVNRGTSFNLTTTYGTGDTIKINGTYAGVEKELVWINLKHNPTIVAWDDWYINPGIFHLWVDGGDVFQGAPQTGEAQTGTQSHHSDTSNYAQKGNAGSVDFQVVGPLLIRIKITYTRFTHAGNLNVDFEDIFYIYYTPDHLTTRIKVRHTDDVKTSFVEASWGDWYHMDYPCWNVTPTQTKLAYHTAAGTQTENLAPGSFTAHYDWDERWVAMLDDVNVEPALGFFFISDSQHTIDTSNFGVENVGGQNNLWGVGWFPRWSVGATVPVAKYTQAFWWTAKKTNQTNPIRNEYIKTVNPLETVLGSEANNNIPQSYANLGSTTNDGTPIGNLQSSDDQYVTFNAYESAPWWNSNYQYRRKIKIKNSATSALPSGYSVKITVDTTGPKFLDNGDDLRIVYAVTNTELDRVNETAFNAADTEIWFKTQASIPAGDEDDSYYMYYGYSGAGSPPANRSQVYVWFDDFSTNTLANYNKTKWVDVHGGASQYISPTYDAVNERVWFDTGDNYASDMYPVGVTEADFLMEVDFWANGSYPTDATIALVGRLENPGTSSTHYYLDFSHGSYDSPGITVDSWVNGERSNTVYSEPSDYYWGFNTVHTFRYAIFGNTHKFWWNKDISQPADVTATDSLHTAAGRLGLAPAQVSGWWDDLKIRKYVEPEPSASLGDEETTSEYTADWYCSFTSVSTSNAAKFTITFEGQYSNASVTQRLYLYSFTDSAWVLFDIFTTSSTPATDETRTFNVTADLSKYVSSGEVRLRVRAVKSTGTQFQCKADYANLITSRAYDYVLKVSNQVGYAWSIFVERSSDSNLSRLSNITIWLHNGGGISKQIQIIDGSYTQTSGSPYSLAAGGTDYIAISVVVSAAGTSQIVTYLKAEIPSSGVHVQLQITFQIT